MALAIFLARPRSIARLIWEGWLMGDVMVTGRMTVDKKQKGSRILSREGLNASQAINLMYDRLLEEGAASFLLDEKGDGERSLVWEKAAQFVDSLSRKRDSRFHAMSDAEIKVDRLRVKGLM